MEPRVRFCPRFGCSATILFGTFLSNSFGVCGRVLVLVLCGVEAFTAVQYTHEIGKGNEMNLIQKSVAGQRVRGKESKQAYCDIDSCHLPLVFGSVLFSISFFSSVSANFLFINTLNSESGSSNSTSSSANGTRSI